MSRYIDADVLKNKLQQHHDFIVNAWGGFREMPMQDKARCDKLSNSIAEILNAPSIDIVRCKDCKHHEELLNNNDGNVLCWAHGLDVIVDRNGYCNYGEREEQEESEIIDVLNELLEYSKGMLTAEKYGLQHKILSMIKEMENE